MRLGRSNLLAKSKVGTPCIKVSNIINSIINSNVKPHHYNNNIFNNIVMIFITLKRLCSFVCCNLWPQFWLLKTCRCYIVGCFKQRFEVEGKARRFRVFKSNFCATSLRKACLTWSILREHLVSCY
jgi:hypothetical protein